MNYEAASELRGTYLYLAGTLLKKSSEYTIIDIVVLPFDDETMIAYSGHIKRHYAAFYATSFDHEFIYKKSGIYILADGKDMPDDLTLYVLLKSGANVENEEYKSELLVDLLVKGEIEGIEDLPQHIEQLKQRH